MVVDNFDFVRIAVPPFKTYSPLIVYPDAPLARSISSQLLQAIARRLVQQLNPVHIPDLPQLSKRNSLDRCKLATMNAVEDAFCFFIRKGLNHRTNAITRRVKREAVDTRTLLVPHHLRFNRLQPPEQIRSILLHPLHKVLGFLPRIEHEFIANLSCTNLFAFPKRIRHANSFTSET